MEIGAVGWDAVRGDTAGAYILSSPVPVSVYLRAEYQNHKSERERDMEKERAFFVNVGGMSFNLEEFDDMPENVRATLAEMRNQFAEEIGEKNVEIFKSTDLVSLSIDNVTVFLEIFLPVSAK